MRLAWTILLDLWIASEIWIAFATRPRIDALAVDPDRARDRRWRMAQGNYVNWLSLAVVLIPITAAMLYRVRVEESVLREAFGAEYEDYRATTRCLVPGIY